MTVVYIGMIASVGVCATIAPFPPRCAAHLSPPEPLAIRGLFATGRAPLDRARTCFLILRAAAKAIAIFGLAAFFLGARAGQVAAIAGFLLAYPSREAFSEV